MRCINKLSDDPIGQQLANELNTTVKAPNEYHMFVSLDQDLEFKWLEIAAENGHLIAQSNLADLFFTQGNKEKAIFWAKKAHRNGAKLPEVASQSNQNGTT